VPFDVVVAVSVCPIDAPDPELEPDTFVAAAVQLNVVPNTVLDKPRDKGVPEQIVVVPVKEATGVGFTVTTIVIGIPVHPAETGVTT
jgi:hypothetical protein